MTDTNVGSPTPPAPAAGAELTIPKYRLDEVNEKLRRVQEELAMKDQLYTEERKRALQAQSPQQTGRRELTPEDTGLDPQTHQAVVKTATLIANQMIGEERKIFEQQVGILANRTEKAELLATRGADKAKYLDEIRRMQQQQWGTTGTAISADICLEIIQAREKDQRIKDLEARLAAQSVNPQAPGAGSPPPQVQPQAGGYPGADGTRYIPQGGGVGAGQQKTDSSKELSIDELEARLEEQFRAGNVL